MAELLRYIGDMYHYLMEDLADPRVKDLPFVPSPWPIALLMIFYTVFVQKIGPQLMKERQPIDVKYPMIIYNIIQMVGNGFFFFECFRVIWIPRRYSVFCAEVDYSNDPVAVRVAFFTWLVFMNKILDFFDTIFMVLRKKHEQISFLHTYHHTAMVGLAWLTTKYIAGGHVVFFGTVNTFVHFVMYTYYLITALYPQYKKNIWWKRHLTELQMVQFLIISLQSAITLLNPYCKFPKILLALFLPHVIFVFLMFWDFYRKAYLKKKNT